MNSILQQKLKAIKDLMDRLDAIREARAEQHREALLLMGTLAEIEQTESRLRNELNEMYDQTDDKLNKGNQE